MTTCRYYDDIWFPDVPEAILALHWADGHYIRFERYMAREPDPTLREPCPCGSPDRWKCWNKTRSIRMLKTRR